jgi:hypothetical protein
MFGELRDRTHRHGGLFHCTIESAFLTAGALLITVLILLLLILFFNTFPSSA